MAPKYPCGVCYKAVSNQRKSIACDVCMQWHHLSCTDMSDLYVAHNDLVWSYHKSGMPNVDESIFNSTISSMSSTASEEEPRKAKAIKSLNILSINFQSIWGKKEIFTLCFVLKPTLTHQLRTVNFFQRGMSPSEVIVMMAGVEL